MLVEKMNMQCRLKLLGKAKVCAVMCVIAVILTQKYISWAWNIWCRLFQPKPIIRAFLMLFIYALCKCCWFALVMCFAGYLGLEECSVVFLLASAAPPVGGEGEEWNRAGQRRPEQWPYKVHAAPLVHRDWGNCHSEPRNPAHDYKIPSQFSKNKSGKKVIKNTSLECEMFKIIKLWNISF